MKQNPFIGGKKTRYGTVEYTLRCLGCGAEKTYPESEVKGKQMASECCSVTTMIVKAELKS